jgi:hypothetical protein
MPVAAPWYESSAFVEIAGLIISAVTLIVTTAAAYRIAKPRRLVLVDMPQVKSLPGEHSWPDIEAHELDGASLNVVEVRMRAKGRWDIPTSSFDRDMPIAIDLGAGIVSLKRVQPPDVPQLKAEAAGTELRIGPGLVRRHHKWNFILLTRGPAACFTCVSPLIDVELLTSAQQRTRRRWSALLLAIFYVPIFWVLYKLGVLREIGDALAAFIDSL